MKSPTCPVALAAFISFIAVCSIAALFISSPKPAAAHQPEGLRVSQASILDYPCPYGHEPTCEIPSSPPVINPYQGASPDTPITSDTIGNSHVVDGISLRLDRLLRASGEFHPSKPTATTGSNDAPPVRAALISEITNLPLGIG